MDNFRITGKESLDILLKKKNQRFGRFIIEVENMDENKTRKFENDLNRYYASCGCTTGNYFLITTLIFCFAYFLIMDYAINNWKIIIEGFSVILIAAILGKFIGKLMDKHKFKETIKNLSQEL